MSTLKLPRKHGRFWTPEEEAALLRLASTCHSLSELADSFERTENSIAAKLAKISPFDYFDAPKIDLKFIRNPSYDYDENTNKIDYKLTENENMTKLYHKEIALLQKGVRTVQVTFDSSACKAYTYKTKDKTIKKGDLVVVYAQGAAKVVHVVHVDNYVDVSKVHESALKWIVCKVQSKTFNKRTIADAKIQKILEKQDQDKLRKAQLKEINKNYKITKKLAKLLEI